MPNYWRCVLVALIFTVITGGTPVSSSWGNGGNHDHESVRVEDLGVNGMMDIDGGADFVEDPEAFLADELERSGISDRSFVGIMMGVFAVMMGVALIVAVITFFVQIFLLNPLRVGCTRFFVRNLNDAAQVKEICYGFDNHYMNHVKIMFFRSLYTFLWALLFVIPGIVKSYEYQMVPYILAENPGISKEDAFALSKRMMDGNKWNAFVLDLSFLGWHILSGITFGIVGLFYVRPYVCQTGAALYERLKNPQITAA